MKDKKKVKNNEIVLVSPQKYTKNNFKFSIDSKEKNITFLFQNFSDFPIKTYQLKLTITDLEKMEEFENFQFKNMDKFANLIRKCIKSDRYEINLNNEGDYLTFKIKSEIFDNDVIEFKIPQKGIDLNIKTEFEALKVSISEIDKKIEEFINKKKENDKNNLEDIDKKRKNVLKILFMELQF